MEQNNPEQKTHRRGFIGSIAASAAAISFASLAPLQLKANVSLDMNAAEADPGTPDEWFNKIKGKHRMVFDATHPEEIMPFAWPKVFLMTNEMTGTPANDCNVVVVLRHGAIPYAFGSSVWEKYKFGEVFKIDDPVTKAASIRNAFWKPKKGDFKVPGIGEVQIGINELQADGVMFCVCNAAMTVYSAVVAEKMGMDAAAVKKEWDAALLPGVQVVPSGVWAVGRAQEHGCQYCFVG